MTTVELESLASALKKASIMGFISHGLAGFIFKDAVRGMGLLPIIPKIEVKLPPKEPEKKKD